MRSGPPAQQRLVWPVLALGVAVMVLTPLTVSAGQWLYDQNLQHQAILEIHAERGQWMKYFAIGLPVVVIALAVVHWLESGSDEGKRVLVVLVAVVALLVGVSSIVAVLRIGDSGAHAGWGGR